MIKTLICKDCVCVPICINRTDGALVLHCKLIDSLIHVAGDELKLYEEVKINFVGLNRVMRVRRGNKISSDSTNIRGNHTQQCVMIIDSDPYEGV